MNLILIVLGVVILPVLAFFGLTFLGLFIGRLVDRL
jgi:hypothetical protein